MDTCLRKLFEGPGEEVSMERFSFGKEQDQEREMGFSLLNGVKSEEREKGKGGFEDMEADMVNGVEEVSVSSKEKKKKKKKEMDR